MNWNKFLPCILLTTVLGACSGKGEQPNVEPTALCLTDSLLRIVSVDTVHVQEDLMPTRQKQPSRRQLKC